MKKLGSAVVLVIALLTSGTAHAQYSYYSQVQDSAVDVDLSVLDDIDNAKTYDSHTYNTAPPAAPVMQAPLDWAQSNYDAHQQAQPIIVEGEKDKSENDAQARSVVERYFAPHNLAEPERTAQPRQQIMPPMPPAQIEEPVAITQPPVTVTPSAPQIARGRIVKPAPITSEQPALTQQSAREEHMMPAQEYLPTITEEPVPDLPAEPPMLAVEDVTDLRIPPKTFDPPTDIPAVPRMEDLTLIFEGHSSDLTPAAEEQLKAVIGQMNEMGDGRLQVRAFAGGEDGTKSSARRISLSRALAVRSYLMDRGITPKRVDVRALGTETDRSPLERVDLVFAK